MKQRTDSYVTTLYKQGVNGADDFRLEGIRAAVKTLNAQNRNCGGPQYRVSLRGRLGKNNPNAYKYQGKMGPQMIKLEDAAYYDVYIHERLS